MINFRNMKNIRFLFILISISTANLSFSLFQDTDSPRKLVYVCDNPRVKCYFESPCEDLNKLCENGKIFKVSVLRAEQLGKEKCDCEKKD